MRSILGVLFACAMGASAHAGLLNVEFTQVNFNGANFGQLNSNWGTATVHFNGVFAPEYFNLVIDGNWVVQNSPVGATHGPGQAGVVMMNFDLHNAIGTNVSSVNYAATLDASPLLAPSPGVRGTAPVGDRTVTPGGSTDQDPPAAPTPPPAPSSNGGVVNAAIHENVPNQMSKPNGCVPTAFSNSLKWLNATQGAGLSDGQTSVGALETACGWTPPQMQDGKPVEGTGGPGPNAIAGKRALVQPNVETVVYPPDQLVSVVDKFRAGADVEIVYGKHMGVVTAIYEMANGNYKLVVQSDLAQDGSQPSSGGDVIEMKKTGPTYTGMDYVGMGEVKKFVVESVVPEPSSLALLVTAVMFCGPRRRLTNIARSTVTVRLF